MVENRIREALAKGLAAQGLSKVDSHLANESREGAMFREAPGLPLNPDRNYPALFLALDEVLEALE